MNKATAVLALTAICIGFFIYIRTHIGDVASINFLFFFAGIATGVVLIALGGKLNDQHQEVAMRWGNSTTHKIDLERVRTEELERRKQIHEAYKAQPTITVASPAQQWHEQRRLQ